MPHDPELSDALASLPAELSGARLDGRDLSELDLTGRDLSGASLEGALLRGTRLERATLAGARLARADLREADLRGADLRGADLSEADLRHALLRGAQLTDARAQGARIDGVEAEAAILEALRRAGGRAGGLGATLGSLLPRRWSNPLTRRARARGRARAAALGPPGADLGGASLRGSRLAGAAWAGVRLDRADLSDASLEAADLHGASLEAANLEGVDLQRARLTRARLVGAKLADADLRQADLGGADLSGADLSGADLREANLREARLTGATLRAARLPDLDLSGVNLDEAVLDQADLSGVSWEGASVRGAELAGALGLGEEDRQLLLRQGAKTGDDGGFSGLGGRWVRGLLGLAALGMGVYLAARFLAPGAESPEHAAEEADALAGSDPLEAAKRYEALAIAAERPEDQVGHRIEAAGLAEKGGDPAEARRLLEDALKAAGDDGALTGRVRLRLGELLADQKQWADAEEVVTPLLALEGQPEVERARAIVLYQDACAAQQKPAEKLDDALASLSLLPEARGALLQAVAEIRANRGQDQQALEILDQLSSLELPADAEQRALASRARVLDRLNRPADAREAWQTLLDRSDKGGLGWMSALLALADLDRRDGHPEAALKRIGPLLSDDADARLHGRALMLRAGLSEDAGKPRAAITDYRAALALGGLDADTVTEARLALARLLIAEGGEDNAASVLADLDPTTAAAVLAEARLGEGRRLLDEGETSKAMAVFDQILGAGASAGSVLDPAVLRAARSGRAEALTQSGKVQEAIGVWQEMLDGQIPADERPEITLLLATALLGRGDADRAGAMFTELASSTDADTAAQGRLGLAEVARADGKAEQARSLLRRVADEAPDPAWRVRALDELAQMAQDDHRLDDALEAWRAVIGLVPAGHPAALDARLSIVDALEEAGRPEDALLACAGARSAATGGERVEVRLRCGELAGRHKDSDQAVADLTAALSDPAASEDQVVQAALALSHLQTPDEGQATLRRALARCKGPSARVPLLAALVVALPEGSDEARRLDADLGALAAQAPAAAAEFYGDDAARARTRGDGATARRDLERALALALPAATRGELLVELGQVLLDAGDLEAADQRFQEAARGAEAGGSTALLAAIGSADVARRRGDPAGAVKKLRALNPSDDETRERWLEALARALGEARDPSAAATWAQLAEGRPAGDETHVIALRGQADAALQAGQAQDALRLYEEATRATTEVSQQGWASLGAADALLSLGRKAEAQASLRALSAHPDPEVALGAAIRASNLASDGGDWAGAQAVLEGHDATALGAAWDATLTEARVRALTGQGRLDEATSALEALGTRWPADEEAQLPMLLGLAHLADKRGDKAEARKQATAARDRAKDPGYRQMAEQLLADLGT